MESESRYVIVGCGVAGISAAEEIRRLDGRGRITLIGDEPYYYRGALSEWLAGRTTEEMLPGRTPEFYAQMKLERLIGQVTRVDPDARMVVLDDDQAWAYERLLIATGARANTISIPGLGLEESLVLRSWPDTRALKDRIGCCGRILILGGGVLGLEITGALTALGGKRVALVHRHGHVGAPLLDAPAAMWLEARIRASGTDLFLEDTVARVDGPRALLESGRAWDFDLLVQAIGVTPMFPPTSGMEVGRGIRIRPTCRTNLESIYAAGDCTETWDPDGERWVATRTWMESARQGRVAGHNMVKGNTATLDQSPFYNASIIFDTHYSYIGEPHGRDGTVKRWQTTAAYRQFRLRAGRLVGGLLLGDRRGGLSVYEAIGRDVAEYGEAIAKPDFPWNAITGSDWDYVFY